MGAAAAGGVAGGGAGVAAAGGRRPQALAGRDYQERMASIFAEMRRVLKADGVMTLMFTHKAAGAWDALTTGLMEAGFAITASWPINTEADGSRQRLPGALPLGAPGVRRPDRRTEAAPTVAGGRP